jgi:thiamine biosynthesis lipoprotein
MKRKELFLAIVGIMLVAGLILSSSNRKDSFEKIGYSMDTQIRMVVYDRDFDESILEDAYKEMLRLDKSLSNFNEESETTKLNRDKSISPSNELYEIVKEGKEISEKTNGAYDITIYPLTRMWHYKNIYVPAQLEIASAKEKISYKNIDISEDNITLKNDAMLDLSSITKGYIADKILEYLKSRGVEHALVDAGGNITVCGSPSRRGTDGFAIGIQDPDRSIGTPLGQIGIVDTAVVTSGIYERNFEKDGKVYHHIIDPKTGYPSESDVKSVSIICKKSSTADCYATAIVVMGKDKGLSLVNATDGMECIIVTKDNKIYLSDGMEDSFVLTSENYEIAG